MRRVVPALLFVVPLVFADGKAKPAAPDYTAEAGRRAVLTAKLFVLEDGPPVRAVAITEVGCARK